MNAKVTSNQLPEVSPSRRASPSLKPAPQRVLSAAGSKVYSLKSLPTGFTLIELLAVITIIAILAGLILGIAGYANRRAASQRTKAEIKAIENALENYKQDVGYYPSTTTNRASAWSNSCLLYNALAGGSKKYFTFTPSQINVSGTTTNITMCTSAVITNVAAITIIDPYGNPYAYYRNPCGDFSVQTNAVSFDLWSYGSDSASGTIDDITNWQ